MRKTLLALALLLVSSLLAVLPSVQAMAQEHRVSGKVTGADGSSLPGITIQVKGTTTGTATDANGQYELSVPAKATLEFRGVGFNQKDVVVGNRSTINVSMVVSTKELNELVVTAFGIKRAARSVGYATASVDTKELNNGHPVDLQTGLTGRVAGLQINEVNNGVNPSFRIVLRGERHITADNQALVVLDGMLVPAEVLSTLNPEDIANVSVLKGASASALYGSEASNGVIIVTTKHGTENGKPRITFTSTFQFQQLSYLPKFQDRFGGNGGEGSILYGGNGQFTWGTDPYTNQSNYVPYENESYGPPFNGQDVIVGGPLQNGQTLKLPYKAVKPPLEAFARTGETFQNGVSYSSGDSKNNFLLSLQDVNVNGVIPKDVSRRDNVRIGATKTYGKFSAQFDLNYARNHSNTVGGDPISNNPVVWNLLNEQLNIPIQQFKNWQTNPFANPLEAWPNSYYTNPWWQIDASRNIENQDRLTGTLNMSLQATSWLRFTYKVGANFRNYQITNTVAGYNQTDPYWYNTNNGAGPWASFSSIASKHSAPGQLTAANYYYRRLQQDFLINFDKQFGDFKIDAFLGNTIWDRYESYLSGHSANLYIPGFYQLNYITGVPSVGQFLDDSRLIGVFGDVTVGYKNWLFLHGSLRNDWTSLLAKGNNSYLYPDIDAAWVFTDAIPSLHNNNVLTYGKLRAAYSVTGEVSVNPYSIENTFNVPGNFPYGGLPALQISSTLNNPKLKPEKSFDKEIGLDLGFWNSRINVSADYYYTKTVNQTFPVQLSRASGFAQAQVNGGTMVSDGWELSVNATPLLRTNGGFTWNVGANMAINNSDVVSLYGGVKQYQIRDNNNNATTSYAVVGYPYPVIKASDYARDPANGKILVTPDGMPKENPSLIIAGRSTPKYIVGFNTSLSYKHFTLAFSGDYRGGYNIAEAIGGSLDFTGTGWRDASAGRQDFVFPNSEVDQGNGKYVPNTGIATTDGNLGLWVDNSNFSYSSGLSNYTAHTNYIISAAAIKLRTASLTYDFSWLLSKTKFIKGGTFSIVGYNLLMFVPSQNVYGDPEFNEDNSNATGYTDQGEFPATRNFGASLTLNF